jgi:hypothetical protein
MFSIFEVSALKSIGKSLKIGKVLAGPSPLAQFGP